MDHSIASRSCHCLKQAAGRGSMKGAMRSVQIGVTRCDDKCENTVLLDTQGPCGTVRRCSDDTVTHDTGVQGKCHKSHPTRPFFCNDEVACQSRRSRFHWRWVFAGVGAEKLGGGSCPNRGPTAVSSSTPSHCPAMVSSNAGLRYQLWISRVRIVYKIISTRIQRSLHQRTNQKCRGRDYTQTESVADANVQRCTIIAQVFRIPNRMNVPKQL